MGECVYYFWVGFEWKLMFGYVYEVEKVVFARSRLIVRREKRSRVRRFVCLFF